MTNRHPHSFRTEAFQALNKLGEKKMILFTKKLSNETKILVFNLNIEECVTDHLQKQKAKLYLKKNNYKQSKIILF